MENRVRNINNIFEKNGDYIAYWMQGAQRTIENHALEYAVITANMRQLPLVVFFNIFDDYPEANLRHYHFMVEGLCNVEKKLRKRGIDFYLLYGDTIKNIGEVSDRAAVLICDKGYLRYERSQRRKLADTVKCPMVEVEGNLIVPVEVTSPKEEYAARTIRSKIKKVLDDYLYDFQEEEYLVTTKADKMLSNRWEEISLDTDKSPEEICDRLNLDTRVSPSIYFKGGEDEACKHLDEFIEDKLNTYDSLGSDPSLGNVSYLSPYLHFGNISPQYIAKKVLTMRENFNRGSVDGFLEELIIRRELSFNFIYYNNNYDSFEGITYPWAYESLRIHSVDEREYIYDLKTLEEGKTHDSYWNAAQHEMTITGYMHGYMRMYWCKKILEWSKDPKTAYESAISLNNKYFLDGRDPNSFTGVAWCFGKHDRAWKEREIYGKVRCMMASGLKRKFNMEDYLNKINDFIKEGGN